MSYGRYFDELSLLSMNQHPVHLDEHFARSTQHGRRLVAGPTVISIVIGMTQADIGGRAVETVSYSDIRHRGPVFRLRRKIVVPATPAGETQCKP